SGLTDLIGFRRPARAGRPHPGVESLDYPFAVAGVPRLVSGAGPGDPPGPCLLITQSPAFSNPHVGRRRLPLWWPGLSGRPSILRHPLVAVRILPARGSYFSPECRVPSAESIWPGS